MICENSWIFPFFFFSFLFFPFLFTLFLPLTWTLERVRVGIREERAERDWATVREGSRYWREREGMNIRKEKERGAEKSTLTNPPTMENKPTHR